MPKVIIIGAGVAGTACAARLAKAGFEVQVVEKNAFSGGRCSVFKQDGFRFDRGPSMVMMLQIFKQCFQDLDENIDDWVDLLKCDNNYRIFLENGRKIDLTTDMSKMCEIIENIEPGGFTKFLDFVKLARIRLQLSIEFALSKNYESILDFLTFENLNVVFKFGLFTSVWSLVSKFFKSEDLRRAFTFQTMYMGMSPFEAPSTYILLPGTEFSEGIYYPRGGFVKVVHALQQIAEMHNASFTFNSPVKRILLDSTNQQALGVEMQDGRLEYADVIVSNCDAVYAYNKLLPPSSYAKKLLKKKLTSSSISIYWGLKRQLSELQVHSIFLAEKYKASFEQIFKHNQVPTDPSFYVHRPSLIDKSASPLNKDSITVLIPAGFIDEKNDQDWPSIYKSTRLKVIKRLEKTLGIQNLENLIQVERISGPLEWQTDFNLHRGSILGLSHNISQVLYFRLQIKHAKIQNLYFCGASVHPGTGVPTCLAGSKLTADEICSKYIPGIIKEPKTFFMMSQRLFILLLPLLSVLISLMLLLLLSLEKDIN